MGFWIQKSKLKNNTKVGFHFQATTEWHFQCCLPNEPTVVAGCVRISRTAAESAVGLAKGLLLHGGRKRWGGGGDPPGSLQDPGEGMRRKCGMLLETVVRNVVFPFFSLSFSKSICFSLALLPRSVCASRQVFILQLPLKGSLITVSPLSLSLKETLQRKRGGGQTFQSIFVFLNCCLGCLWEFVPQAGAKYLILCVSLGLTHWWTLTHNQLLACPTGKGRHFLGSPEV